MNSSKSIAVAAPAERRGFRFDMTWPILIGFALVLIALVVLPMSWLVYFSLTDRAGNLTLGNFAQLVTNPTFLDPLITTVILATSASAICCVCAAPMGWR